MKIVSKGRGYDTAIYDNKGEMVPNVIAIEIPKFTGKDIVIAKITVINVELDIEMEEAEIEGVRI